MRGHATGLERGDGMCVVREDWTLGYKVMLVLEKDVMRERSRYEKRVIVAEE